MLFLASFLIGSSYAQYDRKAKDLLDEVSVKTKSYSTITANFLFVHTNMEEDINNESKGVFELKGSMYKLQFQGNSIYCNGKKIWSHIAQNKELTISNVDEQETSLLNPSKMLTLYEEGFKYKFIQERFEDGRAIAVIDLYPENVDESEYSKVRLEIDKDKKQIVQIQYFSKDANRFTIKIESFKTNLAIADDIFTLEKSEYPADIEEVINLTE